MTAWLRYSGYHAGAPRGQDGLLRVRVIVSQMEPLMSEPMSEPVSEPSTLHHPAEGYRVELDAYNGPLDLLLFLVRRNEIDLHDIPIARLTDQYLGYLKLLKAIDVDLAGEFLVMAATLLEVKSQMLIPAPPEAEQDQTLSSAENTADPRYELVQQLLAYKRYKDASLELDEMRATWEARVPCHPARLVAKSRLSEIQQQLQSEEHWENQPEPEVVEVDLEDASISDLCEAFARILSSIGESGKAGHSVVYDDTPIGLHAEDIMDRIKRDGPITLQQIFQGRTRRAEMIGLFLATLELVRLKRVKITQEAVGGEIQIHERPREEQLNEQDSTQADWRDKETGEIAYEWPDEASRKRAARRARLRALAAERAKQAGGALTEEQLAELEEQQLDDEQDDAAHDAGQSEEAASE